MAHTVEQAFVSHLREEEMRARRALRVLEHQQNQIRRLQQCLQHSSELQNSQDVKQRLIKKLENCYKERCEGLISHKLHTSGASAVDLINGNNERGKSDCHAETLLYDNDKARNEAKEMKGILKATQMRSVERLEQVAKIKREMEHTKQVLLKSQSKIRDLEQMMGDLDEPEKSQANILSSEMAAWRSTIDKALENLQNMKVEDERLWKVALRFFTPQQTLFILSHGGGSGTQNEDNESWANLKQQQR